MIKMYKQTINYQNTVTAPYSQPNHLVSLAKWLTVCLQTKLFRVRVPLQSLKC